MFEKAVGPCRMKNESKCHIGGAFGHCQRIECKICPSSRQLAMAIVTKWSWRNLPEQAFGYKQRIGLNSLYESVHCLQLLLGCKKFSHRLAIAAQRITVVKSSKHFCA